MLFLVTCPKCKANFGLGVDQPGTYETQCPECDQRVRIETKGRIHADDSV